jgi:hypothetical protein
MWIDERANERESEHEVSDASNEVISAVQDPHQGRKSEGSARHDRPEPGIRQSSRCEPVEDRACPAVKRGRQQEVRGDCGNGTEPVFHGLSRQGWNGWKNVRGSAQARLKAFLTAVVDAPAHDLFPHVSGALHREQRFDAECRCADPDHHHQSRYGSVCGWPEDQLRLVGYPHRASTVRYEAASLIVLMVFTSQWKICGISA